MLRYTSWRLLQLIPTLLGVMTIVFILIQSFPGDPIRILLGPQAPDEAIEATRQRWNLDEPLYVQYFSYLSNVLQGDLGDSIHYNATVAEMIANRLPVTLVLTASAFLFAIPISLFLGVVSAYRRNKPVDHISRIIALFGVSTPSFWIGLMLIIVFAFNLDWLPATGLVLPWEHPEDVSGASSRLGVLVETGRHLIMPTIALGTLQMAAITRVERSSMLEELHKDYVQLARAHGVGESTILRKHAFRNAQLPVITLIGLNLGTALGGSVVIEIVFSINGMGDLIITAITAQDIPLVMGTTLAFSIVFLISVVLTDISYAYIDPRVRLGGEN